MPADLDAVRTSLTGKEVVVAGNGPSIRMLSTKPAGPVCTVNAGLSFFSERGWPVALHWIQDRRIMVEKAHLVEPFLDTAQTIAYNSEIGYFRRMRSDWLLPIQMIGYSGFSKEPKVGVFHGYTAIYGLLQLLYYCDVAKLVIYGVGLNYFAENTRFYQHSRGLDVDLHRSNEQVRMVAKGLERFEAAGVAVEIVGPSMLKRASFGN